MISKREDVGIKHLNVSKAFTEYSQCMDDVYNNIDDYNRSRKRKNLIVLDAMIADFFCSKRSQNKFYTLLNNEDSRQKRITTYCY